MKKITILILLILVGCGGNTQIRNIQVNNLEIINQFQVHIVKLVNIINYI